MRILLIAATATLALAACAQRDQGGNEAANAASAGQPSERNWQATIDQSEKEWAALATKTDPSVLVRILADDFAGVSDDGTAFDKRQEIQWETDQPNEFTADTVPAMTYRRFGDTVIAQGQQTLKPIGGGALVRILWTDVWLYRDGKWQVVASQNATVPPKG